MSWHPTVSAVNVVRITIVSDSIVWLSTRDASERLGVTLRTLYRFIDEGKLPAYQLGRVIRLKSDDVDSFIESVRIRPGSLAHLYPDTRHDVAPAEAPGT